METEFVEPERVRNVQRVRYAGMLRLIGLYGLTLGLLYGAFWSGFYWLNDWWGIGIAVAFVAVSSILLIIFKNKTWSAIASCLSVSVGIGLCFSTFFVVLDVTPSRFFGLVLLIVFLYKSLQNFLMAKFRRKILVTSLFIVLEIIFSIVFFFRMGENIGLNSQIGFACVVAVFLSFGQLSLYKCGANDMWRTIALSYIIGFVFIVWTVILLIISILAEDGSVFESLGGISFGDVGNTSKKKKRSFRN